MLWDNSAIPQFFWTLQIISENFRLKKTLNKQSIKKYHEFFLEKKNDFKRAADFYTLSAQCGNSDADLWEKIGRLYKSLL